jgi:hypothetical protein
MLHACVERFDVIDGRWNILGWDGEVNTTWIYWHWQTHLARTRDPDSRHTSSETEERKRTKKNWRKAWEDRSYDLCHGVGMWDGNGIERTTQCFSFFFSLCLKLIMSQTWETFVNPSVRDGALFSSSLSLTHTHNSFLNCTDEQHFCWYTNIVVLGKI